MIDPTFLLIDDDQDDHEIFIAALLDVLPAARYFTRFDCPAAISFGEEGQAPVINYIFMDWHMPLMEAEECIMQLREVSSFKMAEIFILSGSGPMFDPGIPQKLGVKKVITKPATIALLAEQIRLVVTVVED
jgi:CheY-like chemotaxis protein